jgi:cytochrome c553
MTSIRRTALVALLALSAPAFAAAPKGNVAAGQEKSKSCAACHGPTGNESLDPSYPKLAGQYPEYLAKALHDYRSGERQNAIMAGMAAPLSDEDIDDLAAFYAAQPGDLRDLSDVDNR